MLTSTFVVITTLLASTVYGAVVEQRATKCYRDDPDTRSVHTGLLIVTGCTFFTLLSTATFFMIVTDLIPMTVHRYYIRLLLFR